ncbi:MAG: SEC-C domain-containing protein [Betaproteobacteria bacterium]|nr:SEC-C domain-containing protein [Betaproteobacteria bacterium]
MSRPAACPCGSGRAHAACCGPYLARTALPDTAEQLMRSRYSAYVLLDADYLLATWHPDTRPAALDLDEDPPPKWLGLDVKRHEAQDASHATVEFVARYKVNGRALRLTECSRFERLGDRWYYRDGRIDP